VGKRMLLIRLGRLFRLVQWTWVELRRPPLTTRWPERVIRTAEPGRVSGSLGRGILSHAGRGIRQKWCEAAAESLQGVGISRARRRGLTAGLGGRIGNFAG
jgi:hypothetical protein